jgi:hypothetical protein
MCYAEVGSQSTDTIKFYFREHCGDVADVNADAKLNPQFRQLVGVLLSHLALDFHRTARCIDGACELDQHAIASGLDDATAMRRNSGIDERFSERLKLRECAFRPTRLILAPCSARSRRSLATPEPAASQTRRPALTAPARDADRRSAQACDGCVPFERISQWTCGPN